MGVDPEGEVAKHLRAESVTQAHILESDHAVLLIGCPDVVAPPRLTMH
jgi:hypothetical protein